LGESQETSDIANFEGNRLSAAGQFPMARVRITANPANDQAFARRAERLAETCTSPEELERALRTDYERARVVRGVTDIVERWYAYRDGSWTASSDS
jgi:hypothetical protein